jgi:hypothetical protein
MKRITFLLGILILALFSFSSCDAILDALYPMGTRTIIVEMDIDGNMDVHSQPIVLAVIPMFEKDPGMWAIEAEKIARKKFWGEHHIFWEFQALGDMAFRVIAFSDNNDDGRPGFDEPSISLNWQDEWGGGDVFDFRWDDAPDELWAFGFLSDYNKIDPWLIDKLQGEGGGGEFVDNSFHIEGPPVIVTTNLQWEYFNIAIHNDKLQVQELNWAIMYEDNSGMRQHVSFTQTEPANTNTIVDGTRSFGVNFNSTTPNMSTIQSSARPDIIVQVEVIYTDGASWTEEMWLPVMLTDPSFNINGPGMIDKANPGTHWFDIAPNDWNKTVSSIQFRLIDEHWNSVGYDGNYNWVHVTGTSGMDVDFNRVNPSLTEPHWDHMHWLNIEVEVAYNDGARWMSSHGIELMGGGDGGGDTWYDLEVNLDLPSYPSAYYEVYLYDAEYYDWLGDNMGFTDSFGNLTTVHFGNIFDPVGKDQIVEVYIDVDDDYIWDYMASQVIGGQASGLQSLTFYQSDFGL